MADSAQTRPTGYLIDTNVVSMLDPRRHAKAPMLVAWLVANGSRFFVSVVTIMELEAGAQRLQRTGQAERRVEVERLTATIMQRFEDRVLPVGVEVARLAARMAEAVHQQPVALPDILIAATAHHHGLTLVTRNVRDFGRLGVSIVDPWQSLPRDDLGSS